MKRRVRRRVIGAPHEEGAWVGQLVWTITRQVFSRYVQRYVPFVAKFAFMMPDESTLIVLPKALSFLGHVLLAALLTFHNGSPPPPLLGAG